jgi:hypothetical protein
MGDAIDRGASPTDTGRCCTAVRLRPIVHERPQQSQLRRAASGSGARSIASRTICRTVSSRLWSSASVVGFRSSNSRTSERGALKSVVA